MSTRALSRTGYSAIQLYMPSTQRCEVDLSDNTNLWGPAPSALRAMQDLPADGLARYPSGYSTGLAGAIADYAGVPLESVVTGCGSDDILDSAIRAFAEPGSVVAMCDPTFSMIPVFVTLNGATPVKVPFEKSGSVNVEVLLTCGAGVIYLCSPNNPTGSAIPEKQIDELLSRFDGLIILDEAYAEFSGVSLAGRAATSDNLIVTRTMSKAFGLAGIRVGYSVSNPTLAVEIAKSRGPYKVSVASEAAALAALSKDVEWMRQCVDETLVNRALLASAMAARGFMPLPSSANFLLIPVADGEKMGEALARFGVAVRLLKALPQIGDAIRVTVGPAAMMENFLDAFDQARA